MNGKVPHIVQYQGSKRKLAPQILAHMPRRFNRLIEPFSGMAAITIATATEERANSYIINDINTPLISLLREAIENPIRLYNNYKDVWEGQLAFGDNHTQHFYDIREDFNNGNQTPENFLYLLARCVKGSVRYGSNGNFNQSPDKRRHGTKPETLRRNVCAVSELLRGKIEFYSIDYQEILEMAEPGDLVYMDPPYQGVSNTRDSRYYAGVDYNEFANAIEGLNDRGIDYLISYDGVCGHRAYGADLPAHLGCEKILLNAGLSSQATLLGKKSTTFEALYISRSLVAINGALRMEATV